MNKNNLIKTISLTIVAMSLTVSNSLYANAEDSANVEQIKSEIVKVVNSTEGVSLTTDNVKFQSETTVKKEFSCQDTNINLTNEKLYCFSDNTYVRVSYYYGLTSKCVYIRYHGTGGGDLTVLKDGNIYGYFGYSSPMYNETYGWIGDNGWHKEKANTWSYLKNGIIQTGWIYDNGNWYYCYSDGTMAHDTTIDGYYLGSSGAWAN